MNNQIEYAFNDGGHLHVKDYYSGVQTELSFNLEWYGINQEQLCSYVDSLISHIVYVREAGEKLHIPREQLVHHDTSKWSLEELPYYTRNFHGDKQDPDGFAKAWLHHIHNNPHHWQHWIFPDGYTTKGGTVENGCVRMPQKYAIEMIADWMGASMAYTGSWDIADWLSKNTPRIRVHSWTAQCLTQVLDSMGYMDYCAFA